MGEAEKNLSALEIAYQILKEKKAEQYFRDWLKEALAKKNTPDYLMTQSMAELHTQINMDSRFEYKGQGKWGLTEWAPPAKSTKTAEERSASVIDEEVQLRRAKLEEVQQPDDVETTFQEENEEPS